MASKVIQLAGIGPVTLIKRAQSRGLRLSVTAQGVRVSMPHWTPFGAGQAFAENNIDWIVRELGKQTRVPIESGQRIGKMHHVRFEQVLNGQPTTSRVTATEVVVRYRHNEASNDPTVQKRAHAAAVRALRREAERLLPPRLHNLAQKHGKQYTSVDIKLLKRRWGSCSSKREIALNLYLMELPWDCIDYVLMHELAHTLVMNHGSDFWHTLLAMEPRARDLGKQARALQPGIGAPYKTA